MTLSFMHHVQNQLYYMQIQEAVHSLCSRIVDNHLTLNVSKCLYDFFTIKNTVLTPDTPVVVNDYHHSRVDNLKYLGVNISPPSLIRQGS